MTETKESPEAEAARYRKHGLRPPAGPMTDKESDLLIELEQLASHPNYYLSEQMQRRASEIARITGPLQKARGYRGGRGPRTP